MDWNAFELSLALSVLTVLLLLPVGVGVAHTLAWRRFAVKWLVVALVTLPLVLPPTVLGYYLLVAFSGQAPLGAIYEAALGRPLVFSFEGLLLASVVFNLPFAVLPMQRSFEAVPREVREAAWVSGMSQWRTFLRVELPLTWPGLLSAMVLVFAHTMGEFGVVLMVGGNIPGETRTIAIAIYDQVQAFDDRAAGTMSAVLLGMSFAAIGLVFLLDDRMRRRRV